MQGENYYWDFKLLKKPHDRKKKNKAEKYILIERASWRENEQGLILSGMISIGVACAYANFY